MDPIPLPAKGNLKEPAGHPDLQGSVRDAAQKAEAHGDGAAAGAAGQGEVLHAPLEGDGADPALPGETDEADVCALGKGGAVTQGPSPLPQGVQIVKCLHGDFHHGMGKAGVPQLHIGAALPLGQAVQVDDRRVRQPDLVALPVDAPGGDAPRGGLKADLPGVRREAVLHGVAGHAAGAVAAHLPQGAVGIVKEHGKVHPRLSGQHDDEPVGPGTGFFRAKTKGEIGKILALLLTAQAL